MQNLNVIVGCGIAGAVMARRLAEEKGRTVLIVEKRDYIGGYCNDFRNRGGYLFTGTAPIFSAPNRRRCGGSCRASPNGRIISIKF